MATDWHSTDIYKLTHRLFGCPFTRWPERHCHHFPSDESRQVQEEKLSRSSSPLWHHWEKGRQFSKREGGTKSLAQKCLEAYSHDGLHTKEEPHFVILNPESEVHILKNFLSDTTVNLTALSKSIRLSLASHFKHNIQMQQRGPEWWQQRQHNSWFWRHKQSYRLFKTSFGFCPALYKGTPCVQVVSFFLLRWVVCLPACKDAVQLILVSYLMAVTQVAPAHRGAELPQHWPLATAPTGLNGSQQPTILWNGLLGDYCRNTGH